MSERADRAIRSDADDQARGRDAVAGKPLRDRIALRGLQVRGWHGVLERERAEGQQFVVDVVLHVDTETAARTDTLRETVDYGSLADRLAAVVGGEPVNLIETVAGRLADVCLATPGVAVAEVTVHKPEAPIEQRFDDVAVTIVREKGEGPL